MSAIQSTTPSSSLVSTNSGVGSPIQAAVGPASGINYANLITALTASQQQQVTNVQNQINAIQSQQVGYQTLEANLTPMMTAIQALGQMSTFQTYQTQLSDASQMSVTATSSATPGSYQFQTLQLASSQVSLSQGFADENQQAIGSGTLTISAGGGLAPPTYLSALNGGQGVSSGSIRITDRAGRVATINLANAYTVNDVIQAINDNGTASVTASTSGGHLVLTDTSGGSGTLSVTDVGGGKTATGLGIAQTSSSSTITGTDVYQTTTNTLISQINDGNGIRTIGGAPALALTLSDGTLLEVNLDGAKTVGDVLNDINNTSGNGGKLVASIVNGGITLTDNSGGAGTLTASDDNTASVVHALGLDVAASGNTISGKPLLAGINSVLLRNLRGGQGMTQTGQISLQDRTGLTATVDLTGAQSLDQVVNAINNATTSGGQKLHLSAQVDAAGDGLEVVDTSGSTSSNLVIQDVGGSTLASQLGIAVNAATSTVDSGRLNLQYVNEATSLSTYAPNGGAVAPGSFTISDSAGHQATITVTSADQNLGDIIQLINSTSGIQVHAQLNATGDGFSLVDEAGGANPLTVTDNGGTTAGDLRIAGTGTTNGLGQSEIDSRLATVVNIDSTDTLDTLAQKIGQSGIVSASVINDGSAFAPFHLALNANVAGQAGQFFIDQTGLNLGFQTTTSAQNALLRVGSGTSGFIASSSTNRFTNALPGINVQALSVGQTPDTVTVSRNDSSIISVVQNFVTNYNNFISQFHTLTAFNTTTETGGALEGSPTVMTAQRRLNSLITQTFGSSTSSVKTLVDLGVSVNADGSLSLDQTQLQNAIDNNPQDVTNFFTTASTGFSAVAQSTLKSITDPTTGSFSLAVNTLQDSINSYQDRITTLNRILNTQEQQLVSTFAKLESFISQMQAQQQQIALIAPLDVTGGSSNSGSGSGPTKLA